MSAFVMSGASNFIGLVLTVILRSIESRSLNRWERGLLIGKNRSASASSERGSAAELLRSVTASFATASGLSLLLFCLKFEQRQASPVSISSMEISSRRPLR